ncbi:MAG: hypothetical protein EBZ49_05150 [Proteobacteria bacterium]|nr:hypothetical protein [Pseudomonadota bacterium]
MFFEMGVPASKQVDLAWGIDDQIFLIKSATGVETATEGAGAGTGATAGTGAGVTGATPGAAAGAGGGLAFLVTDSLICCLINLFTSMASATELKKISTTRPVIAFIVSPQVERFLILSKLGQELTPFR